MIVISNINVLYVKPKSESCMFYVECSSTVLTNNFYPVRFIYPEEKFDFKFH